MMNAVAERLDGEADIDMRAAVALLWSRKSWLLASMLVFGTAFAAAAFLMTPIYRATTVLMPARDEGGALSGLNGALAQFGGIAALAGLDLDTSDRQTEEALAVLRSREFTERFITEHRLMPDLFDKRWDAAAGRWKGDEKSWPTPALAYKYFDKSVRKITRDRKTGLITVDVEWKDRAKAALWANALVERLNAEMRARAIADTNASIQFLQKELNTTSTIETREAINRLLAAQINRRMLANVTQEYALRVVDRALPPDPKDKVRPKRLMLIALGPAIGFVLGAFFIMLTRSSAASRRA